MAKMHGWVAAANIRLSQPMKMVYLVHCVHQCSRPSAAVAGELTTESNWKQCMQIHNSCHVLYFRQKQSSSSIKSVHQNQFVHQNTDEETSGYLSAGLSDRMSPQMWSKQMPHQPRFQHAQQHPKPSLPKDFSNYIYPSSGDELVPELDEMNIEERRRIPKHRPPPPPSASEIDDNGHETDFTMPK